MMNVKRRTVLTLMGAAPLALAGCVPSGDAGEGSDVLTLNGTIANVANAPVPVGTVTVRLEEQGIMDVAARQIATTTVESDGKSDTVSFTLEVPREGLSSVSDPGFTIRVERSGRLIATNTTKQRYEGGETVSLEIEPILY